MEATRAMTTISQAFEANARRRIIQLMASQWPHVLPLKIGACAHELRSWLNDHAEHGYEIQWAGSQPIAGLADPVDAFSVKLRWG